MTDDSQGLSFFNTPALTPEETAKRAQQEISRKDLKVSHSTPRLYFNNIHSWYVGIKGLPIDSAAKGLFSTKPGDYIVLMNRGVADSLFEEEVVSILQGFHNLKQQADLDVVADVVASRAFDKIIKFDEKRPLVKKIAKINFNIKNVSVDECHCVVMQVGAV